MKTLANKSIFRFIGISALIVAGLTVGQFAYAGWNDASGDCPTVSVGNDTTREGTNADVNGCWTGTNISANVDDKVVVKVYFRNNTGSSASDVKIKVSDNRNATGTVNASGSVIAGGSTVKNGSGTIRLPANTKLVYTMTYIQYKRTGYAWENQGAVTSVFSPGIQVGPIASNLSDQGIVKVVYTVVSTGTPDPEGEAPVATTGNYSPWSETGGTALLHGSVTPNGDATCSYFEIEKNGSAYDTTDENCSNQTTSTYSVPNVNLTGLSTGTYRYRLYAYNDNGEDYGSWLSFTINRGSVASYECNDGVDNDDDGDVDFGDDDGCTSDNDDSENSDNNTATLNVTTDSYSWIDEDSGDIKLYGTYDDNDSGSTITYFEYRRDGGSTKSVLSGTYSNTSRSFNASLDNLADGEYQYRACADNGDVDCGSWKSFSIDKNSNVDDSGDLPSVQTLSPLQIASDFVTFDGYYDMNGCSGKTYFEYGTSTSFGSRTSSVSRSSGASGSMTQSISGLSPNTTYYYRAVGENCEGTTRGITKSFKTSAKSIIINDNNPVIVKGTTTVRNVVTTTNIGGGARYIRLTIDNGRDTIVRGDELLYDVTWENVSNTDLKDLVLEVTFPETLQITSTDKGQIDHNANAVYVNINELNKLEKDDMTIRARIAGTLKDNDPITARAIMAFENPENKAQENAIAYDSDSYLANTNVLGASIFGLDFLPGTLAGWLFIILLLVLLILIIRYATRREEHHHYYKEEVVPTPTRPVVTNTTTTTSAAPEVDYTPYRPTPRDY